MKVLKKSVKEQVLDQLREEILNQTYPLGSRVNLDELRREYGVSNTPLREAIGVLVGEGLLEYRRNAGVFVVSPSREACFQLAQFVLFLMRSAYDYCVECGDLAGLLERMQRELDEQAEYVKQNDIYHYALCSNRFDRCIIDWTQNDYLIKSYDQNFNLLTLLNAEYASQDLGSMRIFYEQHVRILEAMRAGARERVHRLLKEHYYKKEWLPLKEQQADRGT